MCGLTPLFPFYGSKYRAARHYAPPIHRVTVEPFAGGAGYSLAHDVREAVLVEKDPIIAGLWRWLISASEADVLRLPLLLNVGDSVNDHQLEPGERALIGFWLNRGSATPKLSRTAYSARTDRGQLNWSEKARERVAASLHAIRGWTLIEGDFSAAPDIAADWFIDPPYVDKGRFYRVRFTDFDRLGAWAQARLGNVTVCEGPGADWLPFRPIGSFKSSLGRAVEYVWTNDVTSQTGPLSEAA